MARSTRIGQAFDRLRNEGGKAFIAYIMAGAPSLKRTEELVMMLEQNGADIIELGVPFTDPMADGPVIQRAAEAAIKKGVTLRKVLALVKKLRRRTQIPIVLMSYYNPIFKYGLEAFARDATDMGVDGVIIPDLPPHEAGEFKPHARRYGLDTIFLYAPTSTDERIKLVARESTGFIYYVSMTGITGSKLKVDSTTRSAIIKGKAFGKPVALGFGVSTPDEARAVAGLADGVIVGSAIVKRTEQAGLARFIRSLRRGIDSATPAKKKAGAV